MQRLDLFFNKIMAPVPSSRPGAFSSSQFQQIVAALNRSFGIFLSHAGAFQVPGRVLLLDRVNRSYFIISWSGAADGSFCFHCSSFAAGSCFHTPHLSKEQVLLFESLGLYFY